VIEASGASQRLISCGAIRTEAGLRLAERLQQIYHDMLRLIDTFRRTPWRWRSFFSTRISPPASPSPRQGRIVLAGEERVRSMYEYTPLQVKQAITGYGKAEKAQMMEMVRRFSA
jgi:crossover junction endodeoxyribonuclease RuvC